jgi:small-conductance mechanosensitive channel
MKASAVPNRGREKLAGRRPFGLKGLAVLIALAAFAAAIRPAAAQAPTSAEAAKTSAQPTVTATEARQALDVLQDAAKRDALIETLHTIAKTSASSAPPGVAPMADGLGAQALLQLSTNIEEMSAQVSQSFRATTKLPLFWSWLVNMASDPQAQRLLVGILWRLAAVAGLAFLAEYLTRLALRRPLAQLEEHAIQSAIRAGRPEQSGGDDIAALAGRRPFHGWRPFARLPFAAGRLMLEILPVVAFAAVGNALLAINIGEGSGARIAILGLVNAYVLYGVAMSIARAFTCAWAPDACLFKWPAETAASIEAWTRSIVGFTVFGLAIANVALALGLYRSVYFALVKLVILVAHLLVVIVTLRCRRFVASLIRAPEGRRDLVSVLRNRLAGVWHYIAIFINLALWVVWALRIQNGYSLIGYYVLATVTILAVARAASAVAVSWLDRRLHVGSDFAHRHPYLEVLTNRYRPALRGAVFAIVAMVALAALLEAWGIDALAWLEPGRMGANLVSLFSTVAIAIAIALIVWETGNGAMERQLARLSGEGHLVRAARLRTLLPMLRTALILMILTLVGLTALSAIGINIAPLLAGAGIVGIALGFGSQKLVQDVVTGFFLLLENAMQVGDFVTVSGLSGTVEDLSIRTIRLRAGDGSVHIIPFSSVTSVTNTNCGIGNAAISVNLAYDEDTDRASEVLKKIAMEMRDDREFGPMMRGDLALWGVDKVDGAMVTIVGQIECTDSGRWPVQREFNRRMKIRFQQLSIDIAYPGQTRFIAGDYSLRSRRFRTGEAE